MNLKDKIRSIIAKRKKIAFSYQSYILQDSSKNKLLKQFEPKFDNVVAHHITHVFDSKDELPENPKSAKIVGEASDKEIQALVVSINGSSKRPDGGTYHITWSMENGVKPVKSNDLLKKGYTKVTPVSIQVKPEVTTYPDRKTAEKSCC